MVKGQGKFFKCIGSRMKRANFTRKEAARSCRKSMRGTTTRGRKGRMCVYSKGRCHKRK